MKKVVLALVVVAVVAIAGGIFYVLTNLNSIVAGIIEDEGGKVTETGVSVSGVDISLREGRSTIAGLEVASPDPYGIGPAFSLGEITVDIDVESLRSEPIVIDEIRVAAPEVRAEFLANGSSNILKLQQNVQRFAAAQAGEGGGQGGGGDAADQKRIRIKSFVFEEGRIEVDATALGMPAKSLDLPSIRLDDIGGSDGARPDEIAQAVIEALTREASSQIAQAGVKAKLEGLAPDEVKEKVGNLLEKLGR